MRETWSPAAAVVFVVLLASSLAMTFGPVIMMWLGYSIY